MIRCTISWTTDFSPLKLTKIYRFHSAYDKIRNVRSNIA